jgi:molybdate transport system ATP-binding protein
MSLINADHPQVYANEIYLFGKRRGSGETIWEIKERIGAVSSELQVRYRKADTVYDVIASGLFASIGLYRKLNPEHHRRIQQWIDILGISGMADRTFTHLSYGERRMVLLARSMVKSPAILILDEPCQGLDRGNRAALLNINDIIGRDTETSLLYVTHYEDEMPQCISHMLRLTRYSGDTSRI